MVQHRPLAVIADASRSMDPYTHTVLGVSHLLATASPRVEVFAFSTALTRITSQLRKPPGAAAAAIRQAVPDWGTGTRIGPSLGEFNRSWSRRVLTSAGIAVLITDGLDAGSTDDLAREARVLRQRSWRLVWLNPLAGGAGFEPRASGIRALLSGVDMLLPCHDRGCVAALIRILHAFRGSRTTDPLVVADAARWARWLWGSKTGYT